ncbi:N-6 DNA methylase [Vibrio owensii]
MNQLSHHITTMRKILASPDSRTMQDIVNLDSIDMILRELLTIEEMRDAGSFFTGQKLATKLVRSFKTPITFDSIVLDPTCGAGNLLIEASRELGVERTLSETLVKWGRILWGFDIHLHFVEATKLRLITEAVNRGVTQDCDLETAYELLPNIQVRDALSLTQDELSHVTHAIMNPPFTIWPSPKVNYWKSGKVNAAGIVFDKYLRLLPKSCDVSAILPDVLRSGSRYHGFREFVSSMLEASIEVVGRFNNKTDVDVFILSGIINESDKEVTWFKATESSTTISDFFEVRTGPLVAYRDPQEGQKYPYFYPKNCPAWKVIAKQTETRRFLGKVITPPLVVVKRTSSPSDKYRASATLITLREPVAIENHMIIIKPKDGSVAMCKKLMQTLKSPMTNDFLNERIRLRHLTVGVIKDIPF